ncbi:MAG TPA: hypothetical protein PLE55_11290 [Clostridiales bacterium]|nr:hypothetical protein [Clostridiales bacterium]
MKAHKVSEIVERFYWKCSVASHRHKTYEVAQECIDDHEYIKSARRWNCNMYADVVEAIINGKTLQEVGDMFGVGSCRARQVFFKATRMMRHPSMQDEGVEFPLDFDIKEIINNSDFWLGQVKKMRGKRYRGSGHIEINDTV